MQLEEESSSRAINEQQSCRWSQLTGSKGKVSSFKQLPLCLAFLRIKLGPDSALIRAYPFQNAPCPGGDDKQSIIMQTANSDSRLFDAIQILRI